MGPLHPHGPAERERGEHLVGMMPAGGRGLLVLHTRSGIPGIPGASESRVVASERDGQLQWRRLVLVDFRHIL